MVSFCACVCMHTHTRTCVCVHACMHACVWRGERERERCCWISVLHIAGISTGGFFLGARDKIFTPVQRGSCLQAAAPHDGHALLRDKAPHHMNLLSSASHFLSFPPTSPLANSTQDPASTTQFAAPLALHGSRKTKAINSSSTKDAPSSCSVARRHP